MSNPVYSRVSGEINIIQNPRIESRAPVGADTGFDPGQTWVNQTDDSIYMLSSFSGGSAIWVLLGGSGADVNTLSGDSGTANPISGDIQITGTANETETTASGKIVNVQFVNSPIFSRGNIIVTRLATGGIVTATVSNTDNSNTTSHAFYRAQVGGTSGGDPFVSFVITGGTPAEWYVGVDNGSSDVFSIGTGSVVGINTAIRCDNALDVFIPNGDLNIVAGDLIVGGVAQKIVVRGGAVTDFIGTAVLVAGTVTIANTNIAATDRIMLSRSAIGGTLGHLSYTISAATSFTINSSSGTDTSTIAYLIVRQL